MMEVSISEFKLQCVAMLRDAQRTRQPPRIVHLGKPVADVFPAPGQANQDWMGAFTDKEILSDIVSPAGDEADWEVLCSRPGKRRQW